MVNTSHYMCYYSWTSTFDSFIFKKKNRTSNCAYQRRQQVSVLKHINNI